MLLLEVILRSKLHNFCKSLKTVSWSIISVQPNFTVIITNFYITIYVAVCVSKPLLKGRARVYSHTHQIQGSSIFNLKCIFSLFFIDSTWVKNCNTFRRAIKHTQTGRHTHTSPHSIIIMGLTLFCMYHIVVNKWINAQFTCLTKYYHNAYQNSSYDFCPESHGKHKVLVTAGLRVVCITTVTHVYGKGVCTCERWDSIVSN